MDIDELRARRELARAERTRLLRRRNVAASVVLVAVLLIAIAGGAAAIALARPSGASDVSATLRPQALPPADEGAVPGAEAAASGGGPARPETATQAAGDSAAASEPAPSAVATTAQSSVTRPPVAHRPPAEAVQRISIRVGGAGYEPSEPRAVASRPIVLAVGRGEGCAAGFYMPSLKLGADNSASPVTLKLGKLKPGSYEFTCGMGMVGGRLIVR